MDDSQQSNKSHKARQSGSKQLKKDEHRKKKLGIDLQPNRGNNPKAFAGRSAGSHKSRQAMKSFEKRENILHVPAADKTFRDLLHEPPMLVAVVGPPNCGKTTLIRSLAKFYCNRNIQNLQGPITVVAGKARRITFMECPNTPSAMCDISKIADLVLLMVDGDFGFEMETFEFLSISQVHGFPKTIGVVSHLDQLRNNKALKKRKKFLRHRFWHEVAAGAKLICLSPMQQGLYRQTDILKLHRLLVCVEPKVQAWRNTHSCVFVDRFEDITDSDKLAEDANANRTLAFYGYVRGHPLKANEKVHIAGYGDVEIAHLSRQVDPCEPVANAGASQGHKMRSLSQKQKRIYAPYCDVGGIAFDEDAIYVHEDPDRQNVERTGAGLEMLRELQRVKAVDSRERELPTVRRPVEFVNEDTYEIAIDPKHVQRRADLSDDSDEDGDEDDSDSDAMPDLADYGNAEDDEDGDDDQDAAAAADLGGVDLSSMLRPRLMDEPDAVRVSKLTYDWAGSAATLMAAAKNFFVTGEWTEDEGGLKKRRRGKAGDDDDDDSDDDEGVEGGANGADPYGEKGYESLSSDDEAAMYGGANGDEDEEPADVDDEDDEDGGEDFDGLGEGIDFADLPRPSTSSGAGARRKKAGPGPSDKRKRLERAGASSDDESGADDGGVQLDAEADELVRHFIGRKIAAKAAGAASSSAAGPTDDDEFDFTKLQDDLARGNGSDDDDDKKGARKRGKGGKRGAKGDDGDDEGEKAADVDDDAPLDGTQQLTAEQEEYMKKKLAKKKAFDLGYDVKGGKNTTTAYYQHLQSEVEEKKQKLDKTLEMMGNDVDKKIQMVGFFSGLYVRVVVHDIPVEFVRNFDPKVPLFLGGLNAGEDQLQIVNAKIKKHRWFPRILKAQDPVIISIGWRRIQTQPLYAAEDPNGRVRYLKYTPEHMHCVASFYGPVTPPNTGFVVIPAQNVKSPFFRLPATGFTVSNDAISNIVKKLKITGFPQQIKKTTAFIKGMFNSDIEAAKFVGAKIKSASGLRGMIKKVIKGKSGLVRCTFEDKLLMSDIVFIRSWKPVDPPRYCACVQNLLDPAWIGMRTMAQLRRDYNVPIPQNRDSEYKEITRRAPKDLGDEAPKVLMSRNLKMNLPFDMKEEFIPLQRAKEIEERVTAATTVAPEPRQMRKQALLDTFRHKADAMDEQRREQRRLQKIKERREKAKEEELLNQKIKHAKKVTARKQEFRSQHKIRK